MLSACVDSLGSDTREYIHMAFALAHVTATPSPTATRTPLRGCQWVSTTGSANTAPRTARLGRTAPRPLS